MRLFGKIEILIRPIRDKRWEESAKIWRDNDLFLEEHPEVGSFTHILLGVYHTCRSAAAKTSGRTLMGYREAYDHIFGGEGCSWCKTNYKSLAGFQKKFF